MLLWSGSGRFYPYTIGFLHWHKDNKKRQDYGCGKGEYSNTWQKQKYYLKSENEANKKQGMIPLWDVYI